MNERKNIDRLFQEKFKDFEAAPSETVWKGIELRLKEKKKNRKVVPFWLKLSGIAAALILAITITNGFLNSTENTKNEIVIEEKSNPKQDFPPLNEEPINNTIASESESAGSSKIPDTIKESKGNWNLTKEDIAVSSDQKANGNQLKTKNIVVESREKLDEKRMVTTSNSEKNTKTKRIIPTGNENSVIGVTNFDTNAKSSLENAVAAQNSVNKQSTLIDDKQIPETKNNSIQITKEPFDSKKEDAIKLAIVEPNALEELLKDKEKPTVITNDANLNKWQISSNVAPIYFNSTSKGSPLDPQFAGNDKEYKPNISYGLGVRYALNEKLTVRAGLNTFGLEYDTNDVFFSQNVNAKELENVKTNVQGSMLQFENKNTGMPEISANSHLVKKFEGTLNQKTNYIEVPLELSYKIVDRKFGVEIIGGISTLFLNKNEISLVTSGTEMEIGKATNLNNTHFSTNMGLGLKYNFLKSLQMNIEPMFKYQMNTFTDSGNFKPYFFGLYTGINYRF